MGMAGMGGSGGRKMDSCTWTTIKKRKKKNIYKCIEYSGRGKYTDLEN